MTRPATWARGDTGSATIWVLLAAALLSAVAGLVVVRGLVAVERQRAASVADLAALAAAAHVLDGQSAACARAGAVARASRAQLASCTVDADDSVLVRVLVPPAGPLAGFPPLRVSARAGPTGAS
jgi:secretion/DNA translocation related TadE-like protein